MTCAGCGFEILADFASAALRPSTARCLRELRLCLGAGPRLLPALRIAAEVAAAAKPKIAQVDADRRQVTVVFADLCGFTSLSERLHPEEVRAFQGALFELAGQAITRYGGFVAKYLGDAVLALFGAPVAHEDDPERALEAALEMVRRAAVLSETWAHTPGPGGQPAHRRSRPGRSSPAVWETVPVPPMT